MDQGRLEDSLSSRHLNQLVDERVNLDFYVGMAAMTVKFGIQKGAYECRSKKDTHNRVSENTNAHERSYSLVIQWYEVMMLSKPQRLDSIKPCQWVHSNRFRTC